MCRSSVAVGDVMPFPAGVERSQGADGSGQVRYLRPPHPSSQTGRTRSTPGSASERRRIERDLHDGVQTELVALLVKLSIARQDPDVPPDVAAVLADIEGRAQVALDSVRNIARGIYPPVLADFGLHEALRAQAARADVRTSVAGTVPRGTEEAEEAVYFACSEAIQNVVKHAGDGSQVAFRLHHSQRSLVVRISDDGRGFDLGKTRQGVGLRNIRDRIEDLGGTVELAARPGRGTVITLSVPWPTTGDRRS
jgi:signal transduction histidine kinase